MSDRARFDAIFRRSIEDKAGFWDEAAKDVHWRTTPPAVYDPSDPAHPAWFRGGELNTCENALDVHVDEGRGEQLALVYDSPVTDQVRRFTYRQLRDDVARFAGALRGRGVAKGDRVVIYMPLVPEAIVAMLACARLGAIHSVVFGGFASAELATRIADAGPKVVVSASAGIEGKRVLPYKPLLDEAIALTAPELRPESVIILQRPELAAELVAGRDFDFATVMANAEPAACVTVNAEDPLYILYTSGTTGIPKGVVRDNGGHAVALKWSLRNVYGMKPGDTFWAASDIGWVVGHSYIVYAPLLLGCTTVLYEGKPVGTPDPGAFWRVVQDHGVNALFTAPTAFRAIKKEDPTGSHISRYDLSSLRTLFLAGERADPDTVAWAEQKLGVPVIDHWWQTESGWPMAANCVGIEPLPIKHGSPTKPVPGYDIRVVDEKGKDVGTGESGAIVVKLPLPPGNLPTLWKKEEHFLSSYLAAFPGCYETGDAGYIDADGYLFVMSRTDDIINVAGHRLSTGGMEEILAHHPDVAECAVIGVADSLKGQLPVGIVVLNAGVNRDEAGVVAELVALVREKLGPVAAFKKALVVPRLPKTRSGKVLRRTMRAIADGVAYKVPATIDDPGVLPEIADALARIGYPVPQ